jgi:hypothetical protein
MVLKNVFTVLQCSRVEVATGEDGRNVLLSDESRRTLGMAERNAGQPTRDRVAQRKEHFTKAPSGFPRT